MVPHNSTPKDGVGVSNKPDSPGKPHNLSGNNTPTASVASGIPGNLNVAPQNQSPNNRHKEHSARPIHQAYSHEQESTRGIVLRAFAPRVAVYASQDTEDLIRLKGLYGGLCGVLQPFGERIHGKVVIRDSLGASRSWNDFGVHFFDFQAHGSQKQSSNDVGNEMVESKSETTDVADERSSAIAIDRVLQHHMHHSDDFSYLQNPQDGRSDAIDHDTERNSPQDEHFPLLIRKLLSGRPMSPYEMFTHPVACVIAISSQNSAPIESLRDLYNDTRQESRKVPSWVSGEFLRYYVLVHDEDHDDITASMSLFNQMKRHFGLHCHLLRLRSTPCSPDDLDGSRLPACEWLAAESDAADFDRKGDDPDSTDFQQFLFDSDAAVIKSFVREMITQSVIPFMEGRVTNWNDQVASRRKGISGRFMSLSKRWAGFGSARNSKTTGGASPSSNYDTTRGAYNADAPESIMHRLADYAMMLRDWKMSSSIYDILRTDFADDKAWRHHAAVNEMLAVSLLLGAPSEPPRSKFETIDHVADTATYSYITRCADTKGAIRCLLLISELYRNIGSIGAEAAAKWTERLLELSVLTPLTQAITLERLVISYTAFQQASHSNKGGGRKAAFWSFMSSDMWLQVNEPVFAGHKLQTAASLYSIDRTANTLPFIGMQDYWDDVSKRIHLMAADSNQPAIHEVSSSMDARKFDEEKETFAGTNLALHRKRLSVSVKPQPDLVDLMERLHVPNDAEGDGFT